MSTSSLMVQHESTHVPQADTDGQVVVMWLHGKSIGTVKAYSLDAAHFLSFVNKKLKQVTVGDVQNWMDSLSGSQNRRNRAIMAVKSLFSFAATIGYIHFNVAAVVRGEKVKDTLTQRILPEHKIKEIIELEPCGRNQLILKVLYYTGIRVSELVSLDWKDFSSGVLTVFGKGGKTRYVRLPGQIAEELEGIQKTDGAIFKNRYGRKLSTVAVWEIVKSAGTRAGHQDISPHWFRHAHASHSLDRGAPHHLVMATLGHASLVTTSRYSHARPGESSGQYLS